jgi:TetR/AcrR family transcriptional regulator
MTNSNIEQEILKAAQNTFLQYGFHGTKLQQIAEKANISKSLIHYYYRSKEKLYVEILRRIILHIESTDLTNKNTQEENLKVKWFLFTELYNNRNILEKSLKVLYQKNWHKKLDRIKELVKIIEIL